MSLKSYLSNLFNDNKIRTDNLNVLSDMLFGRNTHPSLYILRGGSDEIKRKFLEFINMLVDEQCHKICGTYYLCNMSPKFYTVVCDNTYSPYIHSYDKSIKIIQFDCEDGELIDYDDEWVIPFRSMLHNLAL